ncbi:MAG: winged helix-turn-helix transcriptional regulator [Rhodoglobus sp.]|nr:winged helix-turn-helix transcriptional regulator [Rhodoglobus sp.]
MTRTVYRQVPPKVEYRLSELGSSAGQLLTELTRWGTLYAGRQRTAVDA